MPKKPKVKKILLVDDEKDILWPLKQFLVDEELQTRVLTASSGEEALEMLARERIDLVITDIKMPGISGLDLLVEIKNHFPFTEVMVMTAFPSEEFKREALLKGGTHFVEKPFDIKAVREKVLATLREVGQFSGILSGISLADVIQLKCMSGVTTALRVKEEGRQGIIFFQAGEIIHAICEQLEGEEAFYEISSFRKGHLDTVRLTEMPDRSIYLPYFALLMEGSRRQDEKLLALDCEDEIPAAEPPEKESGREGWLNQPDAELLAKLRNVRGYRASSIISRAGDTLAEDRVAECPPLGVIGAPVDDFFRIADAGVNKVGMDGCEELVLGARNEVLIMRKSGGSANNDGCLAVALFDSSCNQSLARLALEKIVAAINSRYVETSRGDWASLPTLEATGISGTVLL